MSKKSISIFYSYSHKDEEIRDRLETHLSILKRQGIISEWHDRKIHAGNVWKKQIDDNLKSADLILLLISPDFIASDYCYEEELSRAMHQHESNTSVVVPIIIRPCNWENTPFAELHALPKDVVPVTSWSNIDEAMLDVVNGIKKTAHDILKFKVRDGEGAGLLSVHQLLSKEIDRLDNAFELADDRLCTGISTGLKDLDYIMDGLHNSQLIVLASRPGMGKTALALNIASNVAIFEKKTIGYFSMSSTADQLMRRLISIVSSIGSNELLRGRLCDDDWPKLTSAVALLTEAPIFIDESILGSIDELKNRIIEFKKSHSLEVIIIDSLQELAYRDSGNEHLKSYEHYIFVLKDLAKVLQLPIILTSSLPKKVEERINKRPVLNDLSGFENLESNSDVIIFIYRGEVYGDDSYTQLIVAKNNNGELGTIYLNYNAEKSVFI